jgi:hypothetical protein
MNVTGHGGGLFAIASIGTSVGWTNAKTISELEGPGRQIGGSVTLYGANVGVERLWGGYGSVPSYTGWELTVGAGFPTYPEGHGFETKTTIYKADANWIEVWDRFHRHWEASLYEVDTVGHGYVYALVDRLLEQTANGNSAYGERINSMMRLD